MDRRLLVRLLITGLVFSWGEWAAAQSLNGREGDMTAYYDGQLHTINFKVMPPGTATNNKSVNIIYTSDAGLPGGQPFIMVINAIQEGGPGFNPLWAEMSVGFPAGTTPVQFTSDNDIVAAATAGTITLTATGELYRCAVVGSKTAVRPGRNKGGVVQTKPGRKVVKPTAAAQKAAAQQAQAQLQARAAALQAAQLQALQRRGRR
jgi:hypothetical protein